MTDPKRPHYSAWAAERIAPLIHACAGANNAEIKRVADALCVYIDATRARIEGLENFESKALDDLDQANAKISRLERVNATLHGQNRQLSILLEGPHTETQDPGFWGRATALMMHERDEVKAQLADREALDNDVRTVLDFFLYHLEKPGERGDDKLRKAARRVLDAPWMKGKS